jgi:hypothetical protein
MQEHHEQENKNTGRWSQDEHQRFMYGTPPPTQPSCSTEKTGKRFKTTSKHAQDHKSDHTHKSSSENYKKEKTNPPNTATPIPKRNSLKPSWISNDKPTTKPPPAPPFNSSPWSNGSRNKRVPHPQLRQNKYTELQEDLIGPAHVGERSGPHAPKFATFQFLQEPEQHPERLRGSQQQKVGDAERGRKLLYLTHVSTP